MSKKRLLMFGKHDDFWMSVGEELATAIPAVIAVWIGKERDLDKSPKSYTFRLAADLNYLTEVGSNFGKGLLNPHDITLLDYHNFLKLLDRVDVGSMLGFSERNHLFFSHVNFHLNLLNREMIDLIIYSNVPHAPVSYGLMIAAKILKIPMLMVHVTPFPGLVYLTNESFQNMLPANLEKTEIVANHKLLEDHSKIFGSGSYFEWLYMRENLRKEEERETKNLLRPVLSVHGFKHLPKYVFRLPQYIRSFAPKIDGRKYKTVKRHEGPYDGKVKSKLKEIMVLFRWRNFRLKLMRELKRCEISKLPIKFVYLPLHYQPEATTVPGAGFYSDQHVLIDAVSSCLPKDVFLVVKEHPTQLLKHNLGIRGRHIGYWEKIVRAENTILINSSFIPRLR